jgi:hypothetical protein
VEEGIHMGRIRLVALCGVVLAGSVVLAGTAGAVPAKAPTDPCAVMTATDLSGLSVTYSISRTDSELEGNCTYYLENDGGSTPVQLFVQTPIGYRVQKAVTKKVKKVSGLPGGYTGVLNGTNEAAYKSGNTSIRLTGSVSTADLVAMLKSIKKHVG